MKYLITLILLCTVALAQDLPSQNPNEVWVKGRLVPHSWRDGRIFVSTSLIGPLLNVESESRSIDLIRALEEKGGYQYKVVDGRFEAVRDRTRYSQQQVNPNARAQNRRYAKAYEQHTQRQRAEQASQPQLTHKVPRFVAETGFVRAYIRVFNKGGGPSDPVTLVADFTDGYGKPFAQDTTVIPSLQPGEQIDVELFSMIRDEETIANGVIRTVNNEKVKVSFREIR